MTFSIIIPGAACCRTCVTCIREHVTLDQAGRLLSLNAERHLKPPAEMARLFARLSGGDRADAAASGTLPFLARRDAARLSLRDPRRLRHAAGPADRAHRSRRETAISERHPARYPQDSGPRTGSHRRAWLCAVLPDRARHHAATRADCRNRSCVRAAARRRIP